MGTRQSPAWVVGQVAMKASWLSMVCQKMFWLLVHPQSSATGPSLSRCVQASQLPWQHLLSSVTLPGLLPMLWGSLSGPEETLPMSPSPEGLCPFIPSEIHSQQGFPI